MRHSILYLTLLFLFIGCSSSSENESAKKKSTSTEVKRADGSEGEISLYTVQGDELTLITEYNVTGNLKTLQEDKNKHKEIWALFSALIPKERRALIKEYLIFAGEASGTAGFVTPVSRNLEKWQMGIAIDYAYMNGQRQTGELVYTMIHEYGHLLTLNPSQIDPNAQHNTCPTYHIQEGCARSNSYINNLYQNHWKDIFKEHSDAKSNNKLYDFYSKYQDRFVSQYATTNPPEDIAEVFTHFVLNRDPSGQKAKSKISMLGSYSELQTLKQFIRKSLPRGKRAQFKHIQFHNKFSCGTLKRIRNVR